MEAKTCMKCGQQPPLAAFYRHPGMADGHLNKCKECTKADVKASRLANAEHYREYERKRAMRPGRVEARARYQRTPEGKAASARARRASNARHPERRSARVALCNAIRDGRAVKPAGCWHCGSSNRVHGHHADYSRPLAVSWLCQACHKVVHVMTAQLLQARA